MTDQRSSTGMAEASFDAMPKTLGDAITVAEMVARLEKRGAELNERAITPNGQLMLKAAFYIKVLSSAQPSAGVPKLWQDRAPNGSWFVQTEHDGHISFGADKDSAEQCLRALSRVSAQQMQWQPIETAPKDGNPVLLLSKEYTDPGDINTDFKPIHHPARCAIGRWHAEGTSWCDEYGRFPDDPEVDDDTINLNVTGVWFSGGGWFQPNEITHWMSLPSPALPTECSPARAAKPADDGVRKALQPANIRSWMMATPFTQCTEWSKYVDHMLRALSPKAKP